ncbi:RIO1 family regulatory kinase/ATPase domain-containing protein [Candidatus Nanopusillus massiliensis]
MYKNLVRVPIPYLYKGNILVMEYIGYEEGPLLLHDVYDCN